MDKENTDFTHINKLNVSIQSYKNQLLKTETIDDLERIMTHIVRLEQEILTERKKELKALLLKKEEILQKMAQLENNLDTINREINGKISRFRESITNKITQIETENEIKFDAISQ